MPICFGVSNSALQERGCASGESVTSYAPAAYLLEITLRVSFTKTIGRYDTVVAETASVTEKRV